MVICFGSTHTGSTAEAPSLGLCQPPREAPSGYKGPRVDDAPAGGPVPARRAAAPVHDDARSRGKQELCLPIGPGPALLAGPNQGGLSAP